MLCFNKNGRYFCFNFFNLHVTTYISSFCLLTKEFGLSKNGRKYLIVIVPPPHLPFYVSKSMVAEMKQITSSTTYLEKTGGTR